MLFIFMGQSCTGKSTAAKALQALTNAEVYTGKDYLRMGSSENMAWKNFSGCLASAAASADTSKSIIYVITETENLHRLAAIDGAVKVKFTASIGTVKTRFARRMKGNLPPPVEKMLERQFAAWNDIAADLCIDTTQERSADEIARTVLGYAAGIIK